MEKQLLRDLLYVFQGIDGHFIKFDTPSSQFTLNAKVNEYTNVNLSCLTLTFVTDTSQQKSTRIDSTTLRVGLARQKASNLCKYTRQRRSH
jgi:hypothetical protein